MHKHESCRITLEPAVQKSLGTGALGGYYTIQSSRPGYGKDRYAWEASIATLKGNPKTASICESSDKKDFDVYQAPVQKWD